MILKFGSVKQKVAQPKLSVIKRDVVGVVRITPTVSYVVNDDNEYPIYYKDLTLKNKDRMYSENLDKNGRRIVYHNSAQQSVIAGFMAYGAGMIVQGNVLSNKTFHIKKIINVMLDEKLNRLSKQFLDEYKNYIHERSRDSD